MGDDLGLLCGEGGDFLFEEVVDDDDTFGRFATGSVLDDEYMGLLFEREIDFGFNNDESLAFDDWIKCARLEAINWILKTRGVFGFKFQTAYLSMTYFDRFLSRISIPNEKLWVIRVLSVACLSLAAKMEEIKVPGLSQIQMDDYNFESKTIKKMELLILYTLEWKMNSITPFTFVYYFLCKFCGESTPSDIEDGTIRLIFAAMGEINLMNHRPSALAVAATLVKIDRTLTREALELKINSISHRKFLDIENVFSCYQMIQKLKVEKLNKELKALNAPDLFSNHNRKFSITTSCSTKRRLAFENFGQDRDKEDRKEHATLSFNGKLRMLYGWIVFRKGRERGEWGEWADPTSSDSSRSEIVQIVGPFFLDSSYHSISNKFVEAMDAINAEEAEL